MRPVRAGVLGLLFTLTAFDAGCAFRQEEGPRTFEAASSERSMAKACIEILRQVDFTVFRDRTIYVPAWHPAETAAGSMGGLYPAPCLARFLAAQIAEGAVTGGGRVATSPEDPAIDMVVLIRVDQAGSTVTLRNYQLAVIPVFLQYENEGWLQVSVASFDLVTRSLLSLLDGSTRAVYVEPYILGVLGYRVQF